MSKRWKEPFLRFPLWVLKISFGYPRRSLWMLHLVPSILLILTQFGYFFNSTPPGPMAVTQSVRSVVSVSVPTVKSFFTILWIHKIDAAYHLIETETDEYEKFLSPQTKKLLDKQSRRARRICYSIACVYFILYFMASVPQYLSYFVDAPEDRTVVVNSGPDFLFVTPDIGYQFMSFLLAYHAYMGLAGTTAFDTLFIIASYVISTRAMILSAMLKNISFNLQDLSYRTQATRNEPTAGREAEVGFKSWTGDRSDEEAVYRELVRCVKYNQEICKLRDLVEEFCFVGGFFTVILIVISTAIAIVFLVLFVSADPVMVIVIAFAAFWTYFQMIYFCTWGDEIVEKSGDVCEAAYSVYTTGFCSERMQQILVLMMIKAQRPLYFSAGRIIKLDYKTLVQLSRKTYSVCAFALEIT